VGAARAAAGQDAGAVVAAAAALPPLLPQRQLPCRNPRWHDSS
jgi:hypothetical protein